MPDVQPNDRIRRLTTARDAAQAVVDEMARLDQTDPFPPRVRDRQVVSLRAQGDVDDLSEAIENEDAATKVVALPDDAALAELQTLAASLDRAIVRNALAANGLATATTVLEGVAKVRGALDA